MKIKLLYRSPTLWNIILFEVLSFIFLYLQSGLVYGKSVFDVSFLMFNIEGFYLNIAVLFAAILSIYFLFSDAAKFLFALNTLSVSLISFMHFYESKSKFILIVLFLFLISSYYFYQILKIELSEAYINPNYSRDDLFKPLHETMICSIEGTEEGISCEGYLTNWNTNGCFIHLSETGCDVKSLAKKIKLLKIKTSIDGVEFCSEGRLVCYAEDGLGIGVRMIENNIKKNKLNWKTFEALVSQMGYQVELMK